MLKINRDKSIELTRGDSAKIILSVTKDDGSDYNINGDTVRFSVKRSVDSSDMVFQKSMTTGCIINILPEDTASLAYGEYVYDVELTTTSGDVCTVVPPSKFSILPEVTW